MSHLRRTPAILLCLLTISLLPVSGCGTQIGIAASPSVIYVEVGGVAAVNVIAIMDIGSPTAVSTPLTMTADDETVVAVSETAVLGLVEGTAVLSITDGTFSTSATVHVVAAGTLPDELIVTPSTISCTPASEDTPLQVFAVFAAAASEEVTAMATFSSSDNSVALVTADGVVVCVSEGQAVIGAEHLGVSGTVPVTVGAIPPVAVSFSAPTMVCEVEESRRIQVLATWEDGSTTDATALASFSSNDDTVALVSAGFVQCLSEGSARIIASVSGVIGVLEVEVERAAVDPGELASLRVTPSSIECGLAQSTPLTVVAEYGGGTTVDVTNSSQTLYSTSDGSVALLLDRQVVCVQRGQATVQVSFGGLVASTAVNVQ
ncbi:MAG: hypothetical protein PVI86_08230 [Phycisphaerae bacterium]|jgi:hypothetical protein